MKCTVTATGNTINKIEERLKREAPVQSDKPEAVVLGTVRCTAVFYITTSFLDFSLFEKYPSAEVKVQTNDLVYYKPKHYKYGSIRKLAQSTEEAEDTDDPTTLDSFETMEQWELRNARKL